MIHHCILKLCYTKGKVSLKVKVMQRSSHHTSVSDASDLLQSPIMLLTEKTANLFIVLLSDTFELIITLSEVCANGVLLSVVLMANLPLEKQRNISNEPYFSSMSIFILLYTVNVLLLCVKLLHQTTMLLCTH